jgi:hypothetical protein
VLPSPFHSDSSHVFVLESCEEWKSSFIIKYMIQQKGFLSRGRAIWLFRDYLTGMPEVPTALCSGTSEILSVAGLSTVILFCWEVCIL